MSWTLYAGVAVLLLAAEGLYLRLATRFRIVDRPNERSAHVRATVRGGGIIFWLAALMAYFCSGGANSYFFAGLTLVALISFWDDVVSLPYPYRLAVQLISMGLLIQQVQLWEVIGMWTLGAYIVGCGILNAYNFMDGINGITAFYSLTTVGTLLYLDQFGQPFTEPAFLIFPLMGLAVFTFFNARRKALCFAGDVGSVSMAFIGLFLLIRLMLTSGTMIYGLLLAVYGVDSVLTILHRLWLREAIFRAHKLHFYQLLVHRLKWSHLSVAGLYAAIQLGINGVVIWLAPQPTGAQWLGSVLMLGTLAIGYMYGVSRLVTKKPQTEAAAVNIQAGC